VVFGAGATAGPILAGTSADRIGFGMALRLAFAAQTLCVFWLALSSAPGALIVSSALVGASLPGTVSLVLGRVRELAPDERAAQTAWAFATLAFAAGQAIAAYGFAYLYGLTGSYALLFGTGGAAICIALAIDLIIGRGGRGKLR
jgi:predicted MFS family arabinose efflux permease